MLPFAIHPLVPISQTTYRKELEDFISSVAEDREPTVTGAQALNVLSIMEAAKRSFEKQTFVEVN
jgi:predicted dehydrogenase